MSKESDAIDQGFKVHEDTGKSRTASRKLDQIYVGTSRLSREERAWADVAEAEAQDEQREKYHPIQRREDTGTGCLGGVLYAVFVLCISIILATLGWMAVSDMLALNKEEFTATVVLPESIFETEVVDVLDEDGNVTGHTTVRRADIAYLCNTLKQAGLIEYKWLFEAYCKVAKADQKVRPGEYQLQSTYDYRALIQNMRPNAGSAVTVNVTLIEGMTMHDMFVTLERSGVSSYEDLMSAARSARFNYRFIENAEDGEELDATRLEGFLFPETYNFYANMQASSAINRLLDQFNNQLTDEVLAEIQDSGRSLHDLVTIASMIEKEAADDEERADIASVIYNRLRADMTLGIDASILYVHPEHEGAPTAEMLKEKNPYNTRIYKGLPPTPICNPGLASIMAALEPNRTDYIYYALDMDTGRHQFFNNEAEFNAFVATQDY